MKKITKRIIGCRVLFSAFKHLSSHRLQNAVQFNASPLREARCHKDNGTSLKIPSVIGARRRISVSRRQNYRQTILRSIVRSRHMLSIDFSFITGCFKNVQRIIHSLFFCFSTIFTCCASILSSSF